MFIKSKHKKLPKRNNLPLGFLSIYTLKKDGHFNVSFEIRSFQFICTGVVTDSTGIMRPIMTAVVRIMIPS